MKWTSWVVVAFAGLTISAGAAAGALYTINELRNLPLREALAASKLQNHRSAVTWATEALVRDPTNPRIQRLLAHSLERSGRPGAAVALFEQVPEWTIDDRLSVARALFTAQDYTRTMAEAGRVLEAEPRAEAHRLLATSLMLLKNRDRALVEAHAAAAAADPVEHGLGMLVLGEVHLTFSEFSEAAEVYERLLADPAFASLAENGRRLVEQNYVRALIETGRWDDADKRMASWNRLEENGEELSLRGEVHNYAGRAEEAENDWRRALRLDKPYPPAAIKLAELLAERRKDADAVALLERWRPDLGAETRFHRLLSRLYERQGRGKEAAEERRLAAPAETR